MSPALGRNVVQAPDVLLDNPKMEASSSCLGVVFDGRNKIQIIATSASLLARVLLLVLMFLNRNIAS